MSIWDCDCDYDMYPEVTINTDSYQLCYAMKECFPGKDLLKENSPAFTVTIIIIECTEITISMTSGLVYYALESLKERSFW